MLDPKTRIHMIGIGGIGMSALAQLYADAGYSVSGSDQNDSPILERLRSHGVTTYIGQQASNLKQADLIVYSTAIQKDNVERIAAEQSGKPLWKRAQLLADILSWKKSIVVTGCHGKTTTSGMVAWMLAEMELDPLALIGGEIRAFGGNALNGRGEWSVAEGDESDKSFLYLNPDIAVITNIDFDHPDHYRNLEETIEANRQFISRIRPGGTLIYCDDDPISRKVADSIKQSKLSYGFHPEADIRASEWNETSQSNQAMIWHRKNPLGQLSLSLVGRFNLQNALAAVAISRILGLEFNLVAETLNRFPGVCRRMEYKGTAADVVYYDDYGHHPVEIQVTLEAFQQKVQGRRIVVFQPHRYSRTQMFAEQFAQALKNTDLLILTGVYSAGETPIKGVSGRTIFDRLESSASRYYCETLEDCKDRLESIVRAGDVVLTLGAGNVYQVGEQMLSGAIKNG